MNTYGRHLLAEYYSCDSAVLNDSERLEQLFVEAAQAAGSTVVQSVFHRFFPQGISGVVVVQESHLSIHTWPEHGYAAVDFYTCGDCDPLLAHEVLQKGLQAKQYETMVLCRGGLANVPFEATQHEAHGMPKTLMFPKK